MTTNLTRGGNAPVNSGTISISVTGAVQGSVDLLVFQLTAEHKVRNDSDLIFFNQPRSPEGAVTLTAAADQVTVNLQLIPVDIQTLSVAVNLDDSVPGSLAHIAGLAAIVSGPAEEISAPAEGMTSERSAVLVEIYRRNGHWKARNVSAGWNGGLADLVQAHGVVVEDAQPVAPQPVRPDAPQFQPAPQSVAVGTSDQAGPRSVPGEASLSLEKRQTLDLRKREVHQVLLTKKSVGIRARIVMVIDKSGSMAHQYSHKTIHRTVERMVPVATQIDDDGAIEAFLYASRFLALPDLRVEYMDRWINDFIQMRGKWGATPGAGIFKRSTGGLDFGSIGYGNDEAKVMAEIMKSVQRGDPMPTWVLFFTDGGISREAAISKLVRESSGLPIFWQFVGTGGSGYGILERLNNLDNREIDNAGFFAVDDMDRITDADLYTRLISEFPGWLGQARQRGIVG